MLHVPRRVIPMPHPAVVAVAAQLLFAAGGMAPATAQTLPLSQMPAGSGGREPAPNIIISVDDSGSMGAAGMTALRNALNSAFSTAAVPDDSIRLGFQAMWRCRGFGPDAVSNYGGTCPENRVRPLSGAHRTGFNNWVSSLQHSSMTPSHLMVRNAGEFMRTTGLWSPFAKNPGVQEAPLLACRKSFHIFMTDGVWNAETSYGMNPGLVGNADGTYRVLPDGTVYNPYPSPMPAGLHQLNVYRDTHGAGSVNTLADWVFHYWATDLQPGIPNEVRPVIRQPGAVNFGTTASPLLLQEYWNPRNNPATWQSLSTYTIGFGAGAALSTGTAPRWGGATGTTWSGGDYNGLVTGSVTWGNPITNNDAKRKELWHMALNGRGRYVSANNATELSTAFAEIVNQILADSSAPLVSIAASTQSVRSDTRFFVGGYDATRWSGQVRAYGITAGQGVDATPLWDAAVQLNSVTPSARRIYTHNGTGGVNFLWPNLSALQQGLLRGSDAATVGQARLEYLRGERSGEQTNGGTLRTRDSRLGNIVNSAIWTVGRPDAGHMDATYRAFRQAQAARTRMVYVGANDGMLHGFSALDGQELLAYVPRGVYSSLAELTRPQYEHRYFVDGSPFSGDFHDGSAWRTALVGTLAGGGRGFFVLDVTDPNAWTATAAAATVVMDKTDSFAASAPVGLPAAAWEDVGHIYGAPVVEQDNAQRSAQIVKLNNNRWAVLLGNGVNSTHQQASLLIQYLDGAREMVKLVADASVGQGNGLAPPRAIDLNGDGRVDIVYAGDLKGNLWKFKLTGTDPLNWSVAFGGQPLFVARDVAGARQPITSAPAWLVHPNGGLMLAFGTGREMTVSDRLSTTVQTLYAVWDNTRFQSAPGGVTLLDGPSDGASAIPDQAPGFGRAHLVQQSQSQTVAVNGKTFYRTTANPVAYTGPDARRGWYLDWPGVGERTITHGGLLQRSLMYMRSRRPAVGSNNNVNEETCEPQATPAEEYLTLVDLFTGAPMPKPVFDTNGDGLFDANDLAGASRWKSGADDRLWLRLGRPDGTNNQLMSVGPRADDTLRINAGAMEAARVGWRQLQ
jgi:type IV pilus assembly protein PilY1